MDFDGMEAPYLELSLMFHVLLFSLEYLQL
jgi:hypothetical protein